MTRRPGEYARKHAGHVVTVRVDGERFCRTCADSRVAERRNAVRVLTLLGCSARQIAIRLGISSRTVVRDRKRLRQLGLDRRAA